MSYRVYTTEAIVCGTRDRNTTDRSYLLFTRDGGMLFAEARGSRREGSRQRYALQDFSCVRASLVRGKSGWRVGSVEALQNYYAAAQSREARGSVVRLVKVVRRFVRGEESLPEAYQLLKEALAFLVGTPPAREFYEVLVEIRLLECLGYVPHDAIPESLRDAPVRECVPTAIEELLRLRADAIAHSHL